MGNGWRHVCSSSSLWLIYNVVLISAIQLNDSVMCVYIYMCIYIIYSLLKVIFHYGYRILSIVPCAIQ